MDVVNLCQANKEDVEIDSCVVTDDIIGLAHNGPNLAYSIYVVFRRKFELSAAFKLLYFARDKDITRRDGQCISDCATPMWFDDDGRDVPRYTRQAGDVIRLNFFKDNDTVSYSWSDIPHDCSREPASVNVRVLERRNINMSHYNLYLVLPFKSNRDEILVLSQQAYLTFLSTGGRVKKTGIICPILAEHDGFSFVNFACGHFTCQKCFYKTPQRPNPETKQMQDFCPVCQTIVDDPRKVVRAKLRHGPCPVDACLIVPDDMKGVLLRPCGCYIQCKAVEDAITSWERNTGRLTRTEHQLLSEFLEYCPYDACRKRVESIKKVFRHG